MKNSKCSPFACLYAGNRFDEEMSELEGYNPPKEFKHGKEALVAKINGEGDGQNIELYECRMPATFFTIKVLPTPDSLGRMQDGYEISTGSGMHKLVNKLVKAITGGMIGFRKSEEKKQ